MAWKQTGQPTVQKQRDKWVVRVEGIDTETGRRRPRQIGTYASRRSAQTAATSFAAAGELGAEHGTVGGLVDRWVAAKVDVTAKTRLQYEWAARNIRAGIGGVRVDQLERADIAGWLDDLAADGNFSRRSIQIMRMVLRAALADAVDVGELRRSPAARVGLPRHVTKESGRRKVQAWTEEELACFLDSIADHRWAGPLRLSALYGLRRSELLGLRWSTVDRRKRTVRIERTLVDANGRLEWTDGKNARSRRIIPIDISMVEAIVAHRRFQG
jgi:integrase